jgi:Uma2 family endonuclease
MGFFIVGGREMASVQADVATASESESDQLYRISLDVYRAMGDLGLILPEDRVELLDGLLVKRMTKGPRHVTVTYRLIKYLDANLPAGWTVRKEDPIELPAGPAGDSAPEPDVAVVVGSLETYGETHPGPGAVALVVEVATKPSMVARDRRGLARYAWAGLPAAWIVNLVNETVEVFTQPSGMVPDPRYGESAIRRKGDVLEIRIGAETVAVPVEVLLG